MQTETVSAEAIAKKNDELRKCLPNPLPFPHQAVMTDEVAALPTLELALLLGQVRDFNNFTADNDPHSEHDFGKIDSEGKSFFWKFDYFDSSLKYFQENGTRVLTVMFCHEY